MTARRYCTLFFLVIASALGWAQVAGKMSTITADEYRAQLDGLMASAQQLDSSGKATAANLHRLPEKWTVRTGDREFEISTEGLQSDIRRYEGEKSAANALILRRRLQMLRAGIDGFEKPAADDSANRAQLDSILDRPEFRSVRRGSTWADRLKQWLAERILRLLGRLFRSVNIPTIGRNVVYGLMGAALLALIWVAYRAIWRTSEIDQVVPKDLPVSAKEWSIWLSEARAAADKGEWRDAIHLAYWAGISFLERQGFWKPDRARTPREYLRLLPSTAEPRERLIALTRIFELAWYAKREVSEATFTETVAELEKLGCR